MKNNSFYLRRLWQNLKGYSRAYFDTNPSFPIELYREEIYRLRANVFHLCKKKGLKKLLVTSAVPGEGKSVVSSNLALTFSQHSGKVLLVDMDLRKPRLHQLFRESTNPGMTDILRTDHGLEVDFSRYKVSQRIYFVPAGTPSMHPADLLESPRLKAFMTLASSEFDMICVDSPPVLSVPDTVIMSRLVDGAILVLHAGRTNTNDLIRTRDAFSKSGGCEIIGVVMNHFGETNRDRYYEPYLSSTSHDKPAQT